MRSTKLFSFIIVILMLTVVFAGLTPLSAGAGNATTTAAVMPPTARVGNVSTAAVKTTPIVGAAGWHIQTADSAGDVGYFTSLQLTPTGWPAISYYDYTNGDLKYAYKSAS